MFWLIVVIIAHLFNAIVFIIDKYLVSTRIKQPIIYTFYVGILGILSIALIPFGGLVLPVFSHLIINLLSGALYVGALYVFYSALRREEPSRVVPVIGSLVPVFTLFLSFFLLSERLSPQFFIAVILLIGGSALISLRKYIISRQTALNLLFYVLSAFLFAFSFVLIKYVYFYQPFVSAFIWARIGGFLTTLFLLFHPAPRSTIFRPVKINIKNKTGALFLGNQAMGAIAFLLLNFAISLTSVSLVNALQGIQFIFVFIIAAFLGKRYPHILIEKVSWPIIIQKSIAILMIGAGLIVLFL